MNRIDTIYEAIKDAWMARAMQENSTIGEAIWDASRLVMQRLRLDKLNPSEYTELAVKTKSKSFYMEKVGEDLLHASMGFVTEAGEFQDALKKSLFYGKELDKVNLEEEIGDILWYAAIACKALGVNMEDIMERNIRKLQARFPEKFSEEKALNRDLLNERKILES